MYTTKTPKLAAITLSREQIASFLESRQSHPVRVLNVEEYEGTGHYRELLDEAQQASPLIVTYLLGCDVHVAVVYPLNRPKTYGAPMKVLVEPKLNDLLSSVDLFFYLDEEIVHASDIAQQQLVWTGDPN